MTVLETGLFSYADYRRSPGRMVLFPINSEDERAPLVVTRGDYEMLSASELRDQSALYIEAQTALPIAEQLWHEREAKRERSKPTADIDILPLLRDPDLFSG